MFQVAENAKVLILHSFTIVLTIVFIILYNCTIVFTIVCNLTSTFDKTVKNELLENFLFYFTTNHLDLLKQITEVMFCYECKN